MIRQLRIYQVDPRLLPEFDERFRQHAHRIMATYGFDIETMGYSRVEDRVEFVYLLRWPDEETMRAQWEAFLADTEWDAIKRRSRETTGEPVLAKLADQVLTESY